MGNRRIHAVAPLVQNRAERLKSRSSGPKLSVPTDEAPAMARTDPKLTATVPAPLKGAVEQRAAAEGRSVSALIVAALENYLNGPVRAQTLDQVAQLTATPGAAPADNLVAEIRPLLDALHQVLPAITAAASGYQELQEQVDDLTVALGRSRGAALALEASRPAGRG